MPVSVPAIVASAILPIKYCFKCTFIVAKETESNDKCQEKSPKIYPPKTKLTNKITGIIGGRLIFANTKKILLFNLKI